MPAADPSAVPDAPDRTAPGIPRQRRAAKRADPPAPELAVRSLTQPNARSGRLCPSCGYERLTEIGMTLTDGTTALFSSCHRCERKSWRATDTEAPIDLTIDTVLDRSRKIR